MIENNSWQKAVGKKQDPKHFSSEMSDADPDKFVGTETQVSLDFARDCKYITQEENRELRSKSKEVGRLLNHMVENPEKHTPKH